MMDPLTHPPVGEPILQVGPHTDTVDVQFLSQLRVTREWVSWWDRLWHAAKQLTEPTTGLVIHGIHTERSIPVTAGVWAGKVATLTANGHPFTKGQTVTVEGVNPAGFNTSAAIIGTTVNTFSYILGLNPGAFVAGGTASAYPAGDFENYAFFETDRRVWYVSKLVAGVPAWVYASGEMVTNQSTLPVLGLNDTGFLVQVADYSHRLKWAGAAWIFAPGDPGSGMIVAFEIDPTGVGWHLCDGTAAVPYLKADGTLATVNLQNLTGNASYLKLGTPNSGPNAAVAPTMTGAATDSAVTGVTNPANTGNGAGAGTGTNSTSVTVQAGAGATVAANNHTHSESNHTHPIGAPTDPGHTHGLTGVSINANGEPQNLVRRPWFRQ